MWDDVSVNILPVDDANHQLAIGFCMGLDSSVLRRIQVLPAAGGWIRVLDGFLADHVVYMARYPRRFMVLSIDFDSNETRLKDATNRIPESLRERVFIATRVLRNHSVVPIMRTHRHS